ncbi:MAG: ERAP1-like C-terminal domain-containing protein, partial [Myxococcota bacterium]
DARSVDANMAGTMLAIAARFGDASLYDQWLSVYAARRQSGAPPQDAMRYLYTLSAFRSPALVERTLACIENGTVPQESLGAVLAQLLGTHHGRRAAWQALQSSWEALRPRIGDMGISRVVEAIGRLPASERAAVVAFFEKKPLQGAERALARGLAAMDEYEELRTRTTPKLLSLLASSA